MICFSHLLKNDTRCIGKRFPCRSASSQPQCLDRKEWVRADIEDHTNYSNQSDFIRQRALLHRVKILHTTQNQTQKPYIEIILQFLFYLDSMWHFLDSDAANVGYHDGDSTHRCACQQAYRFEYQMHLQDHMLLLNARAIDSA